MNAEAMRRNAEHCLRLAEGAKNQGARIRYERMAAAWKDLAHNQDWLDSVFKDFPPIQPRFNKVA